MIFYDYKIIGMGSITGGELLLRELYNPQCDDADSGILSILLINLVSKIDRSVGGGVDLYSCADNRVFDLPNETFEKAVRLADERWKIMKKIWWKMNYAGVYTSLNEIVKVQEELSAEE